MSMFVSRYLFSSLVALSVLTFSVAYSLDWNLEFAVLGSTAFTLIVVVILERVFPFHPEWNRDHGDTITDLASALVLLAAVDPLLKFFAPLAVVTVYSTLSLSDKTSLLATLPLLAQIVLATLLIEFGRYWSHRLHHAVKPLWWLHAMHHSSKRIYAINNLRFHPVNYGLNFCIGVVPAMLLGFSPEALLGYLAISQPVLMLQHANINLRSGWLNYLFSTNELHRWHHSSEAVEANSNYGNAIALWDQMFGTFRFQPECRNEPKGVGLFSSSRYPGSASYFRQLCSSVRPKCCLANG